LFGLGLSITDRNKLINEVTVIFHGAATVRFDEHIRVAMNINVLGTRELLKLAKEVTNLKVRFEINLLKIYIYIYIYIYI
jgi:fatty acyl-CoA reductase